jgi:prealbumin domain-containing protein
VSKIASLTKGKRRIVLIVAAATVLLTTLILAVPAGAVLSGSPSKFESGDDPTVGVGNEIVNTTGDADWITVEGLANYFHGVDVSNSTSDDSFTPGQKQDTTCPTIEGHKNPPKDDFTDVASYFEVAQNGDTYLYGATIRYTANGNASENIELKQGTTGTCGTSDLLARTPGDKLIAIDYLGGGSRPQFHVLTWIATGACFVSNDPAPCWGADVQTLGANAAEGGVSTSNFTIAQNPISDKAIKAGEFAEFGINLTASGIIPSGECKAFAQTVWESRSSGSSFVSSTKDIVLENKPINNCAQLTIHKESSDGGSQEGAVFTLYEGSDTTGTVVGTCTVDANGDCNDASFVDLNPGTYTVDETTVPAGYGKDPTLPYTFTLAQGESRTLTFTDPALEGALAIVKNSTKGGAVAQAGAAFSYDGGSVTDNGTGDDDPAVGSVCVSGLTPGDYSVAETSPPNGYGDPVDAGPFTATVVNGTNCTDNLPSGSAVVTFTDPPLSDIQVNFRDGGSGETTAAISCDNATGDSDTTPASGWETSETVTGVVQSASEITVTCTITIDP